jgi:hypothetical protein
VGEKLDRSMYAATYISAFGNLGELPDDALTACDQWRSLAGRDAGEAHQPLEPRRRVA